MAPDSTSPKETSVTGIWEQWGGWKLTVSWTKSYYEDGRLVKQEQGGWSTPWHMFRTQIKDPGEIPGIWKDFNSKPFEGIREVISSFELPPGVPFNPADWNLITHATTNAGNNQILTAPFVTSLGADPKNNLTFSSVDSTVCESAPPSTPLLASPITFPWKIGPYSLTLSPDKLNGEGIGLEVARAPDTMLTSESVKGQLLAEFLKSTPTTFGEGVNTQTRPDETRVTTYRSGGRIETRQDGTIIYIYPDGTRVEMRRDNTTIRTYPDGSRVEVLPNGVAMETRPDGTIIETRPPWEGSTKRASFPDGSAVQVGKDGSITFQDPPRTAPPAEPSPQPTDSPAPRSIIDEIDEKMVIS